MNKILTGVTILLVLIVGVWMFAPGVFNNTIQYSKEIVEVEVDKTPDAVKDCVECWSDPDAVKAAQDVIKKKELEAKLGELESTRKAKAAEYAAQIAEYERLRDAELKGFDEEIKAVATELSTY
ncbi:MAG: hypothetical protein KDD43_06580 [Bdellovibrionales bacterium]|nr:hypothetical protein [Bdellovibrionales bacterium]